ncbi:hypothetical protein GPJ61_10275 [Brevibacillus formosus]|uniref:hypothetical protein n=1 Tax=Brevibacillus formosus TaxID=54913 RepID=UPI001CA57F08|nr:hypothetical protein [Brevibacillus formosus]MBW5468242.1 hypothetical protein [Brevibacillus formosus]
MFTKNPSSTLRMSKRNFLLAAALSLPLLAGVPTASFAQEATPKKVIGKSITINGYQLEVESNNKSSSADELNSGRLGKLSPSDVVDWYKFTPNSSGSVTVELSGVPNSIPYRVAVTKDPSRSGFLDISSTTDASRTVTFIAEAGTTYYFHVDSYDNYDTSGNYYLIKRL